MSTLQRKEICYTVFCTDWKGYLECRELNYPLNTNSKTENNTRRVAAGADVFPRRPWGSSAIPPGCTTKSFQKSLLLWEMQYLSQIQWNVVMISKRNGQSIKSVLFQTFYFFETLGAYFSCSLTLRETFMSGAQNFLMSPQFSPSQALMAVKTPSRRCFFVPVTKHLSLAGTKVFISLSSERMNTLALAKLKQVRNVV